MTLEQVGQFATVVAALVVPILVWQCFLLRQQVKANAEQLKLTTETMKATLDGQMFARLDAINGLLAQHYELYTGLYTEFDPTVALKDDRTHLVADIALTFYEHVFNVHHKYEMMDPAEWESWEHGMDQVLTLPYFQGYWKERARGNYKPEYRTLIDRRLEMLANKRLNVSGGPPPT